MPTQQAEPKPTKLELKIAKAICDAGDDFCWRYLKDVEGNPSTAYAYYDFLKAARNVIKVLGLKEKA